MRPDQLDRLYSVSRPAVHPDGWAVVAATRPDFAADAYVGQLWRVPLDGSAPRRITRGFRDTAPAISPDGRLIGFLRAAPGKPAQLAIVPAAGGEPLVVTDRALGVTEFAFGADSSSAVFVSPVPEDGRHGTVDGVPAPAEDPRHITTLAFRSNGRGYPADQRTHVFVVDLPDPFGEPPVTPVGRAAKAAKAARDAKAATGAADATHASAADDEPRLVPPARQLTSGDHDHSEPVVTRGSVVVVAARHEGRDLDQRSDLYRIDLAGGEPTLLTDPALTGTTLAVASPVVVGDDLYVLGGDLGPEGRDFVGTNAAVYRLPVAGGPVVRLTEPEDQDVTQLAAAGAGVVGILHARGVGVAVRIGPDGTLEPIPAPQGVSVTGIAAAGDVLVAAVATPVSPGEVARLGSSPAVLSDFAAGLRAVASPVAARELTSTSPDGQRVQGWVLMPEGEGPHPVLLNIHGGPYAAYGPAFFDEAQVYVAAGYAVVFCNPRGSDSYGQAFGRAIQGDFGNLDSVDVLAFLDHALATVPGLDAARVGVMGGSYGGYLTAWLIAHEHRFAAAVVERAYLDPRSFVGASDIGWFFAPAYNTADPARMDAQSPLLLTSRVTTPTLVLHSEDDLRCPISQAFRYYTELKLAGVDAELLVFPGETHELSRSGRPWHRRQRFEAILDWWRRYLPVAVEG